MMGMSVLDALKELAVKVKRSGTVDDINASSISGAISDMTENYPQTFPPSVATATKIGGVKLAANQAASTATDTAGLVADFNALVAKLKASGVMAADE